jgi:two-component system, NarL family, nitrate/nitrite response regulator NarL
MILGEVGLYRDALARLLQEGESFQVMGVAARVDEALGTLEEDRPDIILVDTRMPGSVDVMYALAAAAPDVKLVALAVPEVEDEVIAFAEAGASGYVTVDGSVEDLADVIAALSRGETLCSPEVAATLFHRVATLARERRLEPIEGRLTTRELEVLRLIEEGLSNKGIASALSIELPTVKNHVHAILEKLNVPRRTEAAARARRHGLARLGGTTIR